MIIRALFVLLIVVISYSAEAKNVSDTLFRKLELAIGNAAYYDADKVDKINKIRVAAAAVNNPTAQYGFYEGLYEEYKLFNFDSAFTYAKKLEAIAGTIDDPLRLTASKNKLGFILLSAGLYTEAYDYLSTIDVTGKPDLIKAEYYAALGRYYYDMADYSSDRFYMPAYVAKANSYIDSALLFYPVNSYESIYFTGLKNLKKDSLDKAYNSFHNLINNTTLTKHQLAVVASTLSYIYQVKGDVQTAIEYQARAAIADIESCTKETFATLSLAQLLFNQGDFNRASIYIKKAIGDASFYGARQRKVQVSAILPIIQSSEINYVKNQRRLWIVYAGIVSFAVILLAWLVFTIYRQNKRLQQAKLVITEAHENLHTTNAKLQELYAEMQEVNRQLLDLNGKLVESNKIKEEYIGHFFTGNSAFFHKMERVKSAIEKKLVERRLDDVRFLVNNIDIKGEKDELLNNFDKAFLKFFPHFVEEFNALFREEDRIALPDGQLLNTDLRIYALIRLGIKENEKIAEILEYSIKSIYAYKTRIRNRAHYPKEEFEKKVMEIKSI